MIPSTVPLLESSHDSSTAVEMTERIAELPTGSGQAPPGLCEGARGALGTGQVGGNKLSF
jgi:hypothetical protein